MIYRWPLNVCGDLWMYAVTLNVRSDLWMYAVTFECTRWPLNVLYELWMFSDDLWMYSDDLWMYLDDLRMYSMTFVCVQECWLVTTTGSPVWGSLRTEWLSAPARGTPSSKCGTKVPVWKIHIWKFFGKYYSSCNIFCIIVHWVPYERLKKTFFLKATFWVCKNPMLLHFD